MAHKILAARAPQAAALLFAAWFGTAAWLCGISNAVAETSALAPGTAGFADIVDKVKPAVVGVRTKVRAGSDNKNKESELSPSQDNSPTERFSHPFGNEPRDTMNQGSGFFISSDGYAITTNHVVDGSQRIEITTDDNQTYPAKVVGSDSQTDLALLKIDADRALPFVRLATNAPRIGEWVLAVGNPFGLGGTVTAGIVSARARDIDSGAYSDFIQIDAPINQGNSGGPTFDIKGDVIGVNSAIFSPSGGSVGIGFAIPAETANAVIPQLKEKGAVIRGWLGVQVQSVTPEIADGLGSKETRGALVVEPQAGGPAQKAGLSSGDIIVTLNAHPIKNDHDLRTQIGATAPGTTVQLGLLRSGEAKTAQVKLGEMPRAAANAHKEVPSAPDGDGSHTSRTAPLDLGFALTPGEKRDGVLVIRVDPDGLAAERGFDVGDVIVDVGGHAVKTPTDVQHALADARVKGKHVVLARVKTGEKMRFVAIPVG